MKLSAVLTRLGQFDVNGMVITDVRVLEGMAEFFKAPNLSIHVDGDRLIGTTEITEVTDVREWHREAKATLLNFKASEQPTHETLTKKLENKLDYKSDLRFDQFWFAPEGYNFSKRNKLDV